MQEFFHNQIYNKFFWVPFALAFGAALYFAMPAEPNVSHPILAFIAGTVILLFGKVNFVLRGAMLFLCGFLYAICFTHYFVSTPILKYSMHDKIITAQIRDIDIASEKTRLKLSVPAADLGLSKSANVKLTVADDKNNFHVGDTLRAKASLFPPASIEVPESFDYARWAYFNNLTATGFISDYEILNRKSDISLNRLRNIIHTKANSFLTDGLVLGYKNSVPVTDKNIWTTAGVGHIWSISGFHMTLIGGWLFALFYLIFRSIGFIARRIPARIVATICAWMVLAGYVCISGFSVATLRAFLMTSLLFIALLVGRNAVSMRNICIAFLILFFINPNFVTTAGFQLSFAAIFGLIWFFGDKDFKSENFISKLKNGFYVAAMTAIVATAFTLPFIAVHFSSVPLYSLLGNLILLPIFSFIIMPLVILGTICSLFGGHLLLNLAMNVYDFALSIAQNIANMPGAKLNMPHIPNVAFAILIIGFLCLIFIKPVTDSALWIYRRANYLLFVICITIGITIIALRPRPIFYITPDHELIGMVYDGKLEFNKARASNHYFAFDAFRKLNGEPPTDKNIRRKCPDSVCIYKSEKFTIAYIQKFRPLQKHFAELCRDDDIDFIVSFFDIYAPRCQHKILHNGFVIYQSGYIKYTPTNRWWNNPRE